MCYHGNPRCLRWRMKSMKKNQSLRYLERPPGAAEGRSCPSRVRSLLHEKDPGLNKTLRPCWSFWQKISYKYWWAINFNRSALSLLSKQETSLKHQEPQNQVDPNMQVLLGPSHWISLLHWWIFKIKGINIFNRSCTFLYFANMFVCLPFT